LLIALGQAWQGKKSPRLHRDIAQEMLTRTLIGPYGLGAGVDGHGEALVLTKAGINLGYQNFLIFYPANRPGIGRHDQFRTWQGFVQGADPSCRHTLWLAQGCRFN
jgi:hypothetical protein